MNLVSKVRRSISERIEDWRREQLIRQCERLVMNTESPREKRRLAFAMMAELIRERTPRRIRSMELRKFGRSFLD